MILLFNYRSKLLTVNISKFTSKFRTILIIKAYEKWIKPGEDILDVGCGTGVVTKIIKDHFSSNITGCDIKNYLITDVPFIKIERNKIPIGNGVYDIALLNDVLHHVEKEEQIKLLMETKRVAKRVMIFEFKPTLMAKLADIILNKLHYGSLKAPLSLRTITEWQKLFQELGFKYYTRKVRKPFWYPFSHFAFNIVEHP